MLTVDQPPKRRADASPQVPPVNSNALDAGLNDYALDLTPGLQLHTQQPSMPLNLNTFDLEHQDPIIHSAEPISQAFSF